MAHVGMGLAILKYLYVSKYEKGVYMIDIGQHRVAVDALIWTSYPFVTTMVAKKICNVINI
jgi:hypothetical protein